MWLEFLEKLLTFLAAIAWPVTVLVLALALRGKISDFLLKHNDTELRLKLVQVQQSTVSDLSRLEERLEANPVSPELLEEIRVIKARALGGLEEQARKLSNISGEAESCVTASGRYGRFNNGYKTASIELDPGFVVGKTGINFPIAFSTKDLNVTFVGDEIPAVLDLNQTSATVSLAQPNKKPIRMIVTGM